MFWIVVVVIIVLLLMRSAAKSERARIEGRPNQGIDTTKVALWVALVAIVSRMLGQSERKG
jgi:hypothetical protein